MSDYDSWLLPGRSRFAGAPLLHLVLVGSLGSPWQVFIIFLEDSAQARH